jgi:hypothetical protein
LIGIQALDSLSWFEGIVVRARAQHYNACLVQYGYGKEEDGIASIATTEQKLTKISIVSRSIDYCTIQVRIRWIVYHIQYGLFYTIRTNKTITSTMAKR